MKIRSLHNIFINKFKFFKHRENIELRWRVDMQSFFTVLVRNAFNLVKDNQEYFQTQFISISDIYSIVANLLESTFLLKVLDIILY
jgi:hypothetical protein